MLKLTLEAIELVDAIARHGSFAAAAERLYKVPSTIFNWAWPCSCAMARA